MIVDYSFGSFTLKAEDARDEIYLCDLLSIMSKEDAEKLDDYLIIKRGGGEDDYMSAKEFEKQSETEDREIAISEIEIGFGGL